MFWCFFKSLFQNKPPELKSIFIGVYFIHSHPLDCTQTTKSKGISYFLEYFLSSRVWFRPRAETFGSEGPNHNIRDGVNFKKR